MIDKEQIQKLYQYSFSLTAETASAEDLLQSAIEKYIRKGKLVEFSSAYLRTIIRNQFIDDCRHNKIIGFESIDENTPALLSDTNLEELCIQQELIIYIFSQLATGEREVLYLWAVLGYSAAEISRETGQARGTVLSRLHRVKQKINLMVDSDRKITKEAE